MPAPVISTGALLASTGLNALGGLLGSGLSQSYNKENMALQDLYARQLMKYQWDNFSSPAAQIKSFASQGVNPAALLEGGKISGSAPTPTMPATAPIHVDNLMDISALSQLLTAVGSAKKAGADVKVAEENAKNLAADTALKDFQNELNQMFGKEFKSVELSQAYQNLLLLSDTHDLNEIEKAIGEYKKETEKAVASAKGSEAEILRQRLENNPTLIALENRLNEEKIKTEQSVQANQYASASNSRELRRLNAALADVEEAGKQDKIKSLLNRYKADNQISDADYTEALLRLERLSSVADKRDNSVLFREVDSLLEWIKDKVSIFKTK